MIEKFEFTAPVRKYKRPELQTVAEAPPKISTHHLAPMPDIEEEEPEAEGEEPQKLLVPEEPLFSPAKRVKRRRRFHGMPTDGWNQERWKEESSK